MIFVDASVLVDELLREADAFSLIERLAAALCRVLRIDPAAARVRLDDFLQSFDFEVASVGAPEAVLAVQA